MSDKRRNSSPVRSVLFPFILFPSAEDSGGNDGSLVIVIAQGGHVR